MLNNQLVIILSIVLLCLINSTEQTQHTLKNGKNSITIPLKRVKSSTASRGTATTMNQYQEFTFLNNLQNRKGGKQSLYINALFHKPLLFTLFDFLQQIRSFITWVGKKAKNQDIRLYNRQNYAFMAPLLVGSQKQELWVHLDSGSRKLVLQNKYCENCVTGKFDQESSDTFQNLNIDDNIYYQDGSGVLGKVAQDIVGFSDDGSDEIGSYTFLLATQQSGFWNEDGLLGLARPVGEQTDASYKQLISELYLQKKIQSRIFSFFMADQQQDSTLQIGDFDRKYFKNKTQEPFNLTLINDGSFLWKVKVTSFRVGLSDQFVDGTPSAWNFKDPKNAILDTGTSRILVPQSIFPTLINAILRDKTFIFQDGVYYGPCNPTTYFSVFLTIDNYNIEIPSNAFIERLFYRPDGLCSIGFQQNINEDWLLGDTFLINYYSIWDHDGSRVGLIPHITSQATITPVENRNVTKREINNTQIWQSLLQSSEVIIAFLMGSGAILGIGIYVAYVVAQNYDTTQTPLENLVYSLLKQCRICKLFMHHI